VALPGCQASWHGLSPGGIAHEAKRCGQAAVAVPQTGEAEASPTLSRLRPGEHRHLVPIALCTVPEVRITPGLYIYRHSMTSFGTPASPAIMTAFVLELAERIPPLDQRVREACQRDELTVMLAQTLAQEKFVSSITLSHGEDPRFDVPTVLLFSAESWEVSRSSVGVVPAGERDLHLATWHEAVPTATSGYLLVPSTNRLRAISYYRVTPDDEPSAYAMRVGTVFRDEYDEVVWENDDDRCHLVRYSSGALRCFELNCEDSCGGGVEVDFATGIEHLPCGCPQ
jgi:hypothetical protein